jgi:hypothetical protein
VLHVPKLRSPLLSVRCFRRLVGCSFIAVNKGSFLTFPTFILPVDDCSDCTITGRACSSAKVDFDSRIAGSVAAVSDNTRFNHQRRPILSKTLPNYPQTDEINLSSEDSLSLPNTTTHTQDTPIESTLKQLHIDPSTMSTSSLSPTQVTEITTAIVDHLQKHGRFTLDLINFINDGTLSTYDMMVGYLWDCTTLPLLLHHVSHFQKVPRFLIL